MSATVYVFPTLEDKEGRGGSGVIVSAKDGLIVTAAHVIGNNVFAPILVYLPLPNGKYYGLRATLVNIDYSSDLALLFVPFSFPSEVQFGSSLNLSVGSSLYAITNFHAEDPGRLTRGYLIQMDINTKGQNFLSMHLRLVPGSSGGGVFDEQGKLVGIARAYFESDPLISQATPVEAVRVLLNSSTCEMNGK